MADQEWPRDVAADEWWTDCSPGDYAATSYIDDDVPHKRLLLCPSRQEDDGLSRSGWYGGRFSINGSLWISDSPARTGPADGKPPVYRFCGRVSSGTLRNTDEPRHVVDRR